MIDDAFSTNLLAQLSVSIDARHYTVVHQYKYASKSAAFVDYPPKINYQLSI